MLISNAAPNRYKWVRSFIWVLIIALILSIIFFGVAEFSRSQQKGENYISLQAKSEAQATGKNPCDILSEWLAVAKQAEDTAKVRTIQQAQKFLGCRNVQKRN